MDKEEKEVTLEDLYWATLSKNDIIRILKDNCSKNIILEKQKGDLEAKLAESEERLKAIDDWKENYGYTNYEDVYMLEDLQSRAFQSEDDTKVVNEILDYLNISDENEILSTLKQQLAEKEGYIKRHIPKLIEANKKFSKQLREKEKEISQLYPFVKEHNNGNFIEYNVVYEKNGIVATTTFGRNKEMAYDYLNLLKKGK